MSYYEIRVETQHPDNYALIRRVVEEVAAAFASEHYATDVECVNEGGDVLTSFHIVPAVGPLYRRSEVARVRAEYLLDPTVSHADYGRMMEDAARADEYAEFAAERPEDEE